MWKAGYGHVCDKPRNRTGCWACMKIESVVFMGFYKNTPRCEIRNALVAKRYKNSLLLRRYRNALWLRNSTGLMQL